MIDLSRAGVLQAVLAALLFWAWVAHPKRIWSYTAFMLSVASVVFAYALPYLFVIFLPPTRSPGAPTMYDNKAIYQWLNAGPHLLLCVSLIFAFIAFRPNERSGSA
jgi:hypothetical protein